MGRVEAPVPKQPMPYTPPVIAASALTWGAIAGIAGWYFWTNLQLWRTEEAPTEIGCAELVAAPPDRHWVRVTGCTVDLAEAHFIWKKSKYRLAWIPLRPDGAPADGPASLVLYTDVAEYLAIASPETVREVEGLYATTRALEPVTGASFTGLVRWTGDDYVTDVLTEAGVVRPDVMVLAQDDRPMLYWVVVQAILTAMCAGASLLSASDLLPGARKAAREAEARKAAAAEAAAKAAEAAKAAAGAASGAAGAPGPEGRA